MNNMDILTDSEAVVVRYLDLDGLMFWNRVR
jgi:hypothetical protein